MTQTTPTPKASPEYRPPVRLSWHSTINDLYRTVSPQNFWGALGWLGIGLTITLFGVLTIKANVDSASKRDLDFISNEVRHNISDRLSASAQILLSGAGLFDASETVSREEWKTFTQSLQIDRQLPGIQGLGFAQLISSEQLALHMQEIRTQGFPEYQISPAGERSTYSSIIFLEPFLGRNLRAFGYDMLTEPVRRAAMERARDENTIALSGKVTLVQETGEDVQAGALMYIPVYRHGLPIDTVDQRRAAIIGWVYSPYRMTDFMNGTLRGWNSKYLDRQIILQVYDGDVISSDTLLYDSQNGSKQTTISLNKVSQLIPVNFAGHIWTLQISQLGELESSEGYAIVWWFFGGGLTISLLLFGLAFSLLSTRTTARRMAHQLTMELQKSDEVLRASESRLRAILNNSGDAIGVHINGIWEMCNPAAVRLFGVTSPDELVGTSILNVIVPNERERIRDFIRNREIGTDAPTAYLTRGLRTDGSEFDMDVTLTTFQLEGKLHVLVMLRDITELNQAKIALQESEIKYRLLFENMEEGFALHEIILDKNGKSVDFRFLDTNKAFERHTGMARDIIGKTMLEVLPQADLSQIEAYGKVASTGDSLNFEYYSKIFGRYLRVIAFCTRPGRFATIFEDITTRKQAEEALRQSEEKLRVIINTSPDAMGLFDMNANVLMMNLTAALIFGYETSEEMVGKNALDFFMPEDREKAADLIKFILVSGLVRNAEFKLLRKNGTWFFSEFSCSALYETDGKPGGIIAVTRDITERKQMELRINQLTNELQFMLKESELKFWKLVEQSPSGISLIDFQGKIIEWNTALETITGISASQAKLYPLWDILYILIPDELKSPLLYKQLKEETLHELENPQGVWFNKAHEKMLQTPDGGRKWVESVAFPIQLEGSRLIGNVHNDITARKGADEQIHQFAARAESLARISSKINSRFDLETILNTVCEETLRAFHVPAAGVSLYDDQRMVLDVITYQGLPPEFKQCHLPTPIEFFERVMPQSGAPGVILDIQALPESLNTKLYAEYNIRTCICARVTGDRGLIGTLGIVTVGEIRQFTKDDLTLLQGFADQTAQAINNVRLFAEVTKSRQHLLELTTQLIEVQEAERRSLALELHDELGQVLNSVKLTLDILYLLPEKSRQEQLDQSRNALSELIERVRQMALVLRPNSLDELGLLPTLEWLFTNFEKRTQQAVQFRQSGLERRFSTQIEITVYRIIQEALTNIIRHAKDKHVSVEIWVDEQFLHLQIIDKGGGFDVKKILAITRSTGLNGMRERARLTGGELVIESTPGEGTILSASLPITVNGTKFEGEEK